jgi:CO dehydrogenase nickel-insertion accessory protein CooC1
LADAAFIRALSAKTSFVVGCCAVALVDVGVAPEAGAGCVCAMAALATSVVAAARVRAGFNVFTTVSPGREM